MHDSGRVPPSRLRSARFSAPAWVALCTALLLTGCGDDEPEGDGPPASPSSSVTPTSPTEESSPTEDVPAVEPATGPRLALEDVALRMPEGWTVDENQASFQVNGTSPNGAGRIYLSSFPSLDPDVSIARLARITVKNVGYPKNSIQRETTLAGRPAFHVAGRVAGDDVEQFGTLLDGNVVAVEFVFYRGKDTGRQELIDSVLASVKWR